MAVPGSNPFILKGLAKAIIVMIIFGAMFLALLKTIFFPKGIKIFK